jgi:hypothetical protein
MHLDGQRILGLGIVSLRLLSRQRANDFNFACSCYAFGASPVASDVDGADIRDRTIGRYATHTLRLVGPIVDMYAIENGVCRYDVE